jgi:four helix bundle protein
MSSGAKIQSFRDLHVWQSSMNLVVRVYKLTRHFPKSETYGLANQVQRAVVSVPSNIAEGHTRAHIREYFQHVSVARASLAEASTQIEIAGRLQFAPEDEIRSVLAEMSALGRQLTALRESLRPLLDQTTKGT